MDRGRECWWENMKVSGSCTVGPWEGVLVGKHEEE